MNNSLDNKGITDGASQDKSKKVANSAKPQKKFNFGLFALIAAGLIILLAITMTVVMFIVSMVGNGGQNAQDNTGNYLAIFAILITLISIVVPITSYITNKDEVRKLSQEFHETRDELTEDVGNQLQEKQDKLDEKANELDVKYAELLENIIYKSNITSDRKGNSRLNAHVDYVSALSSFQNGAYDKCKRKLNDVIELIIKEYLGKVNDEDVALLLYKSLNLYRKAAGRTRYSSSNLFGYLDRILAIYADKKYSPIYKVCVYMSVTAHFDQLEKSFNHTVDESLIEKITPLIEELKSEVLYYNTLLAQKYQILAYYRNQLESHTKAIDYAKIAYGAWDERKTMSLGKAEKRLDAKCAFEIAKVLEKSSIVCEDEQSEDVLKLALNIVQELIRNDKNCKYFLELSEIHKKLGDQEKSDIAAEYGLSLSPTDPLLAAQCAYIYLRKYFANTHNLPYLIEAEERIGTAYWSYSVEKDSYKDKSNSKFHYIASLHAVISTFTLIAMGKKEVGEEEAKIIESICASIDNSILDNPNNIPNYKRAIMVYVNLAEQFASDKDKYLDKIKTLINKFKTNVTLEFNDKEAVDANKAQAPSKNKLKMDFKEFVGKMNKIDTQTVTYEQIVKIFDKILKNPRDNI